MRNQHDSFAYKTPSLFVIFIFLALYIFALAPIGYLLIKFVLLIGISTEYINSNFDSGFSKISGVH